MRIGLITGEFPPMQGGVGAFTEQLARALAELGHTIHVISHRDARPQSKDGSRVSLRQLRAPVETEWGVLHAVARKWGWADVSAIAQLAIRHDLDVLNIQYQAAAYNMRSPAINLAPWRLRGIAPVVTTFHDLRVPYLFPKAGGLRQMAVRFTAQKSNGAIATNEEDRIALEQWMSERERVAQIPIGSNIPVHDVSADEVTYARRRLNLPHGAFVLGYFGFLNPSKGADLLLSALAQLDNSVHLVFIGGLTGSSDHDTNRRFVDSVDAQAQELGIANRVQRTGFLPDREISAALQVADLIVMPYRDGASLRRGTLMAALAHGRPILSTKPQLPVVELAHGSNIWLVARDDAPALAHAVEMLKEDGALRARLASGARELSTLFRWDRIAAHSVEFFQAVGARGDHAGGGPNVG